MEIAVRLCDLFDLAHSESSTNTIYQNQNWLKTLWSKVDLQQEIINKQIVFNDGFLELEMMINELNDSNSKIESALGTLPEVLHHTSSINIEIQRCRLVGEYERRIQARS